MILSHRIQLAPTFSQRAYFAQACGTARFVWNLALAEWNRQYESGDKPNGMKLKKEFNATKYERFEWLKGIHRDAHSQPFAVANDKFRLEAESIILPKIGRVKLTEMLRFTGKLIAATVSCTADKWFISIQIDVGDYQKSRNGDEIVGVDLGIKASAVASNGEEFHKAILGHVFTPDYCNAAQPEPDIDVTNGN